VKRIDINYGGQTYSIGGRDLADITREVEQAVQDGGAWLTVNDGEGEPREALLFVGPGTPIAVIPIPDQNDSTEDGAVT
jgi:hypothetical protein